ncbi:MULTISPECIES: acyl-CoA dehydrogenase family protein [Rhodobacterales]|jgi:butyryl-CoA dehydrogenase|uniref:Acyl-CoA dehydrogenase n=7 Tax=Rhodobacterales TaxID=204455 RepID=A0A1I7A9Q8_9RHOB|nr:MULTISPECIES: acyl-CoA dehydrogenase family protein [Rhodobacterales]AKO98971.1 Acyl-CoA dehydrogenase [Marinovum algicola DG 898]MCS5602889.1 acyl-CoA dehydrogenase family protein [Paracoccus sp. (in: a-proteobacteria)]MEC7257531.1 acyl-CoA dehydrogenase family protein [Pseudomonadota bacterium]APE46087.1 butyryl-CoA dehydrogenase [Sulfitobacter alexandrii]AUC56450.1 butyryl-CoA dehydrogenase [Sagittula sp. P11]|tara:strand:+ start:47295 stop:48470 length:1176 start_codon:yes stop_codon:yes gene_type:complete
MFKLDPELEDFRNEARKLAEREFAPRAAHWDEAEEFPAANRDKLAELGYLGMFIPEEYGGSGAPVIQGTVFLEEMARVCFNTALVSQLYLNGPSRAISVLGSDEQKKRFLPDMAAGKKFIAIAISEPEAGSAVTDLRTTATRDGDGWVLNGNKCWSTGAHVADYALVFCRFGKASGAKGIGAFVVDLKKPGARIGHISLKMGGRGLTEAEIILENYKAGPEDVLVEGDPESSRSFALLMSSFGPERVGNAAMCVGLAQGAFDAAKSYSEIRHQFGRPIKEFQGLQWKIADMATQIHAARLMVYRAATNPAPNGFPDPMDATMAKLYANEMAQRVTNEALQIHGHNGYTREYPLERMVRDARGFALGGGTVEILRNTIAAMVYGHSFDQRRG